jgi:uncharacterized membrane protein YgcG
MFDSTEDRVLWIVGALVVWALLSQGARGQAPPDSDDGFGGFGGGSFGGGGAGGSF